MKKTLAIVLAFMLAAVSCAALAQADFAADADFAYSVTRTISLLGDNPDVGNRSCGSQAEREAADFIKQTMTDIGLANVTEDAFTADTWTFNRGRVYFTDANGEQQFVVLGGFATNLVADMQDAQLVYVGNGTEADYEGLDVTGKIVLFDINQAEDWWIEIPAYEAYTHGALCALACNVAGYAYYDEDTIGSQDICGPEYAAAFSVSQNASKALREAIEREGGEAAVKLDVESIVAKDGQSQNIWGEIPGKTDEVIYFFAHYDGYYHSYFDDASGVGTMLAIAKAMVESGWQPDKTIRFVAHGAEEWGKCDTEYDWSKGAYEQITNVHPEWAENAFAILNIDGMYPVVGHTAFAVAASYELVEFANEIGVPVYDDGAYGFVVNAPTTCWTEDFSYQRAGIPTIVASHANPDEVYHGPAYHSSMDNEVLGVDMEAWKHTLALFCEYANELDKLACRPLNFVTRVEALAETAAEYEIKTEFAISELTAAAEAVNAKIKALNDEYKAAVAAGETEKAAALREEGIALDAKLWPVFKQITAATYTFDWEDNVVFPFEMYAWNVEALEAAIACLNEGDGITPIDELLFDVDYNWYAYDFSEETYAYMLDKMYAKADGTWGEGMIRYPGVNLWGVIHSLMEKNDAGDVDFAAEIEALDAALATEQAQLAETEATMAADVLAITESLRAIAE